MCVYLMAYDITQDREYTQQQHNRITQLYNNFNSFVENELSEYTPFKILNTTYLVVSSSANQLETSLNDKFNALASELGLDRVSTLILWISEFSVDLEFEYNRKNELIEWNRSYIRRVNMNEFI